MGIVIDARGNAAAAGEDVADGAAEAREAVLQFVVRALQLNGGRCANESVLHSVLRVCGAKVLLVLVIQVDGADLDANSADGVLFRNMAFIEEQHPVEIVLHDLLHADQRSGDRTVSGEGLCARVFHGNAQNRISVTLHVVRVDKLVLPIDLLLEGLAVVCEEPLRHQLLAPLVLHTHRDQDVTR